LTDYKVNLQITFSHQNYAILEPNANVVLKLIKGNNKTAELVELEEKQLDGVINRLKEIYGKVKI
jgi:hypothetical protein